MFLDYSIGSDEDRLREVRRICDSGEDLTPKDLEYMADYLLRTREGGTTVSEHRKEYPITTKNRNVTHRGRNVPLDTIGDAVSMFAGDAWTAACMPTSASDPITEHDILTVPGLAANRATEAALRRALDTAEGERYKMLKAQLIEVWHEAYMLRAMHRGTDTGKATERVMHDVARMKLDGEITVGEDGYPHDSSPITLFDPLHVSCLLQWYLPLREEVRYDLGSDMHWLLIDFAALVRRTLPPGTTLHDLAALRAIGYRLRDIPAMMERLHGISKNVNQWNYVLTHMIPTAISKRAQKEWLTWYYSNKAYGDWKRCGKCGRWKLLHPLFWAKNSNRYYSICKDCRKVSYDEPGDVHLAVRRNG